MYGAILQRKKLKNHKKGRELFKQILSKCCEDQKNLKEVSRSDEGSKEYIWFECKKCKGIYLKRENRQKELVK